MTPPLSKPTVNVNSAGATRPKCCVYVSAEIFQTVFHLCNVTAYFSHLVTSRLILPSFSKSIRDNFAPSSSELGQNHLTPKIPPPRISEGRNPRGTEWPRSIAIMANQTEGLVVVWWISPAVDNIALWQAICDWVHTTIIRRSSTHCYTGSAVPPVFIPRSDLRNRVGSTVFPECSWPRSTVRTVGAPAARFVVGGLAGTDWHVPWTTPRALRRRLPRSVLLWSVLNRREWLPGYTDNNFNIAACISAQTQKGDRFLRSSFLAWPLPVTYRSNRQATTKLHPRTLFSPQFLFVSLWTEQLKKVMSGGEQEDYGPVSTV